MFALMTSGWLQMISRKMTLTDCSLAAAAFLMRETTAWRRARVEFVPSSTATCPPAQSHSIMSSTARLAISWRAATPSGLSARKKSCERKSPRCVRRYEPMLNCCDEYPSQRR
eukprot:Amastigsp_a852636_7.p4 type:complete len:113 gc:universal Amastigsp_a852636_7:494-832(+)